MSTQAQELIVRKSVVVDCSAEHAFETFTARLQDWWPFQTHAPGEEPPAEAVFEPQVGGRVYSLTASGQGHEGATVTAWEPPSRVARSSRRACLTASGSWSTTCSRATSPPATTASSSRICS